MSVNRKATAPVRSSLIARLSRRLARSAKGLACDDRAVADPRVERYARLLVERCVDVQPGWQALVVSTPLGRPLVDEVVRQIARRGAYAVVRLNFHTLPTLETVWTTEAPEELLDELPAIEAYQYDHADCYFSLRAPENTREGSE